MHSPGPTADGNSQNGKILQISGMKQITAKVQDVKLTDLTHKGIQEWMIRGLSYGKFTGVVLTESIAESVLTARLLSALREKRVDINVTVKAIHKDKTKKNVPEKLSEATKFIQPFVDMVVEQLQPYIVTMDQSTTSSGHSKGFQHRQKLQHTGIPIAPVKRESSKQDVEQMESSAEAEPSVEEPKQPVKRRTEKKRTRKKRKEQNKNQ